MKISIKDNNKQDVTVTEHIPMMKLLMDLSAVLEEETNNHEKILSVIAKTMIERYSLKIFCFVLASHILCPCWDDDSDNYDSEVIEWADKVDSIMNYPVVINNTEYDEEAFYIMTCSSSDINYLARYCMELQEQENEKQN